MGSKSTKKLEPREESEDCGKNMENGKTVSKEEALVRPKEPGLYYELVVESLGQHEHIPDCPGDIFFAVQAGAEIPVEVMEIQGELENTAFTIRQLYQENDPDRHRRLFGELLSAAKLLAGPKPNPVVVGSALQRLQERVLAKEGAIKKSQYLNALGKRIIMTAGFIAVLVICLGLPSLKDYFHTSVQTATPYLGVMFATAAGAIWLSFASRMPSFSFEDLLDPSGDMLGSRHRIIYVMLFTAILALFAHAKLMGAISIGSFSTDKISSEYVSAAIFGFACGFSEKLLASTVAPHVTKLVGGLGKPK
jgi:hypothetical protein